MSATLLGHSLSLTHLSLAQGEGEGLAPVPGAVHLGAVGQSEHIMTLHLLPGPGEAGPVPGLKSLDVNTHDERSVVRAGGS